MKYRKLGASDLDVSEISLGSWLTYGVGVANDNAVACVNRAFELGINFIDTANVYGRGAAESFLGEVLAGRPRDSYVLATKVFFPMGDSDRGLSRAQIAKQIDASLKRLRVDHVDLYQCHRYDTETPIEETMQALSDVVRQGKARYIGFSEWSPQQIENAFAVAGAEHFVSSQPQYSLLWRKPEEAVIPICTAKQVSQIVWSPLAQGVLSGKYVPGAARPAQSRASSDSMGSSIQSWLSPAILKAVQKLKPLAQHAGCSLSQFALAWVLREPNVASAIVGASRPEQLEENAMASGLIVDPEIFRKAEAIVAMCSAAHREWQRAAPIGLREVIASVRIVGPFPETSHLPIVFPMPMRRIDCWCICDLWRFARSSTILVTNEWENACRRIRLRLGNSCRDFAGQLDCAMTRENDMKTYQHFINGQYVDPAEGKWFDSIDPYRGEPWARIPQGCARDVDRAVTAAAQAMQGPWSKLTPSARGKLMLKLADLVVANADRLAEIEVRDNGKLLAEMRGQLVYHPEWWRYFGGLADKIEGAVVPIDKPDTFAFTRHEPVGVVAALTAWNSPLLFIAWKCAPAIAAGCTVVVKPSEFTSASTLEFAALTKEAGFPDGVFNVVTGYGQEAGAALVDHPGVAKITFTGSDTTGAKIYAQAARTLKRVSLELGGKSPNIVFEDCDLGAAAAGAISGIFAATGQTCIAGSRLLVQNSIREEFSKKVVELGRTARKGDPMLPDTNIGPVTTAPQYRKILDYMEIAKAEGARCILGGGAATATDLPGGQFVEPTIFTDVRPEMRIAREEVFGPVLSIIGFEDEAEAVTLANDTIYGLAAGVWTKDMNRALRMSAALKAGTVWINTYRAISYMMPFGGMKHSGIGRESGIDAIREYLETKSVWISMAEGSPANPFVMR